MNTTHTKYTLVILLLLVFLSCNEDKVDPLFSEPPAERLAQSNSELLNALTAKPQGYKAVYFSKNDKFGGFTFYMKFNADGTVQMTSDVDTDTALESSSYEVRTGTTTDLIFTTRNHIQKLSDPNNNIERGKGYEGTSVFQFFKNDNDTLTFKDIRNRDTSSLVLTPSGLSDFENESVAKINTIMELSSNILPTAEDSVFQVLEIKNGDQVTKFDFSYDPSTKFANLLLQNDDEVAEYKFGLSFSDDGFSISPAFEYDGERYETFSFDETTRSYTATSSSSTASLLFSETPAFIGTDYELVKELGKGALQYRNILDANPKISPGFKALLEQVSDNLAASGNPNYEVVNITYYFNIDSASTPYLFIFLTNYQTGFSIRAFYDFTEATFDSDERKIYTSYANVSFGDGITYADELAPIRDFFGSKNGLIYKDEGGLQIGGTTYTNRAGTFTSADDPSLRVYFYW